MAEYKVEVEHLETQGKQIVLCTLDYPSMEGAMLAALKSIESRYPKKQFLVELFTITASTQDTPTSFCFSFNLHLAKSGQSKDSNVNLC